MLIAISGIDGCGKSLQVDLLQSWLVTQGLNPIVTKAYDDMAKLACRQFIEEWTDDAAIMFLFQALHAQQYANTARALKAGRIVIADRWDESFLAYHQSFGFLAPNGATRALLNQIAFRGLLPEKGFLIQVPIEIARLRRESRGKVEKLEDRPDDYYKTIQAALLNISLERGWEIIDGTKTPQEIHREIVRSLGLLA